MVVDKISECCNAPFTVFDLRWNAGVCSVCKEENSAKEEEELIENE